MGIGKYGASFHHLDLAALAQLQQVLGQSIDDLASLVAKGVEVHFRLGEMNAPLVAFPCVGDQLGGVQEGLGENAADVEAGTARLGARVDQRHLHPLVGRQKCRGIPAGTGTQYDQVVFLHFIGHGWNP